MGNRGHYILPFVDLDRKLRPRRHQQNVSHLCLTSSLEVPAGELLMQLKASSLSWRIYGRGSTCRLNLGL